MTTASSLPEDAWMICPAVKAFIRVCALVFGISSILIAAVHLLTPLLMVAPEWATPLLFLGTWATFSALLSLACLLIWGARVLLASRGNLVTRILSSLASLAALYTLLIPLTAGNVLFCYSELERTWESFLLLTAVTAFFAYPYTRGYSARGRKMFLAWGILAACNGLQSLLFFLSLSLLHTLSGTHAALAAVLSYAALLLSVGMEAALAFFSAMLAWRLFRHVMAIASMPEKQDPEMPGQAR